MAEDFQPSCNWWSSGLDVSQATSTSQPESSVAAVVGGTMPRLSDESSFSTLQLSAFGSYTDHESSFHAMHQDDPFFRQVQFREMSQRLFPVSASCSSPMPGGLIEPDSRFHQPRFDDYQQITDQYYQSQQQLQSLWKASSGFHPTSLSSPGTQSTGRGGREKMNSSEPAVKKPRTETRDSPLPAFKVRKEKLGDRITALQQLVSPFGKSDTASVLHEVIEYIKFLHDQVTALSTPYLKNEHAMEHHKSSDYKQPGDGEEITRQGLRSRGLCLVPVVSMAYTVASESSADFWSNPTPFGRADEYR